MAHLKSRAYVGEISHRGTIHAADHEPIIERQTYDAVQASLAKNAIVRKTRSKASAYLLAGLIFDSAGNRMRPSHSRKESVRYRYYGSQAILQSRKDKADQVFRVPAPEAEALVERFLRGLCRDPQEGMRSLIEARVQRVTVRTDSISVELRVSDADGNRLETDRPQTVNLPWSKKAFRSERSIIAAPGTPQDASAAVREAVLTAVASARRWVGQLMAGGNLADIARHERKGERQIRLLIPLAFVPPNQIRELPKGKGGNPPTLAKSVPVIWPDPLIYEN